MQGDYDDVIKTTITIWVEAFLEREGDLAQRLVDFDGELRPLLFLVGLGIMGTLLNRVCMSLVKKHLDNGLSVKERKTVEVCTLFGEVAVASPYLRRAGRGPMETARPLAREMDFRHRGRTRSLEKALTSFGSEQSFEKAAQSFKEHYGWEVFRTTVRRVTLMHARAAEAWLDERLSSAGEAYNKPLVTRPGVQTLLAELDGSMVRTGVLERPATEEEAPNVAERTPVYGLIRGKRPDNWREVRVGLVRAEGRVDKLYVGRMDKYPQVVKLLFLAAVDEGLSERTQVVCVSDGGNGLREEMEAQFPNLQFILDKPHLLSHLCETTREQGLEDDEAQRKARDWMNRISSGAVEEVLADLAVRAGQEGPGAARAGQLHKHLSRFKDAVHYDHYEAMGWPIGSGEVESAHRQLPQPRLKIPGACWHPDTINPMMALRVMRANSWWDDYWTEASGMPAIAA